MTIVVTGFGSTGDLLPLRALAVGLARAGHDVVYVAERSEVAWAEQSGLQARVLAGSAKGVLAGGDHGVAEVMATGRVNARFVAAVPRLHGAEWIDALDHACARSSKACVGDAPSSREAGRVSTPPACRSTCSRSTGFRILGCSLGARS